MLKGQGFALIVVFKFCFFFSTAVFFFWVKWGRYTGDREERGDWRIYTWCGGVCYHIMYMNKVGLLDKGGWEYMMVLVGKMGEVVLEL